MTVVVPEEFEAPPRMMKFTPKFYTLQLLMVQKSSQPFEVGSLSHYLQGFSTIQTVVGLGISEPSRV